MFAATYYVTGQVEAGNFGATLTRIDALYFTVTVSATVGFGDIVARTEVARLFVTLQMLADLVLIGLFTKVLLGAAQRRRRDLDEGHLAARALITSTVAGPFLGAASRGSVIPLLVYSGADRR